MPENRVFSDDSLIVCAKWRLIFSGVLAAVRDMHKKAFEILLCLCRLILSPMLL